MKFHEISRGEISEADFRVAIIGARRVEPPHRNRPRAARISGACGRAEGRGGGRGGRYRPPAPSVWSRIFVLDALLLPHVRARPLGRNARLEHWRFCGSKLTQTFEPGPCPSFPIAHLPCSPPGPILRDAFVGRLHRLRDERSINSYAPATSARAGASGLTWPRRWARA